MPRPLVAAANRTGARNLVPMVFQNRCSGRCSSVGVCSIAFASMSAVCWAPAQVPQEASGVQRAAWTPEAPSGSMTTTWPSRARWARVARSRSGFTEVARSGPDHSRTAGMTRPVVFELPVGPNTSTEWQSSAASNRPKRPGVRPKMTRPGSGSPTVSSRSSRPPAQAAACLAGRSWPGRCPAARPGRCRMTAAVPPDRPPTTPVKAAYMPAGPGSGPRTSAGQARAGSLQCWGSCHRTWATSAGDTSSQVCPNASPAACPVAHTSAPAPAAAPTPTARS